ncbi:DegQ family serine endoprotease [Lujinxingia vulgaris]|uniref:DegQ family serine endoprotease n=2 Tax=Lujinxingia vulgaris TaxID=2600176 RepID=A0A5C6X925_9DELT|nr:DegQ family serine endoprotease [Lujinxingia vulgaris]
MILNYCRVEHPPWPDPVRRLAEMMLNPVLRREEDPMRRAPWMIAMLAATGVACFQPETSPDPAVSAPGVEEASVEVAPHPDEAAGAAGHDLRVSGSEMAMRLELPDVVEKVMPSVVGINTERSVRQMASPFGRSPFGGHPFFGPRGMPQQPQERVQEGLGSGVIVDAEGIVLTNNHVIEGADTIRLTLNDGREFEAEVVGSDPQSDIAVLRFKDAPDDLKAIEFGDSDALRLAESVVAIGNPFGLSSTVTLGIVSAKGRGNMGIVDYEDFIQTDAAINPGNSGGALVNLRGELVGINTAILSKSGGYQGVGFAIPSKMARGIMESLVETGKVSRGWLGVMIQELTPELASALEIPESARGVVVSDVQPQSPAARAGLQRGDLITSIAGRSVSSPGELKNRVGMAQPGTEVEVAYLREGQAMKGRLELGALEDAAGVASAPGFAPSPVEGLSLQALNDELRAQLRVPPALRQGVAVTEVAPGSEAARLRLRPGDVILEVNRRPVSSPADVSQLWQTSRGQVLVLLYRQGATIFMTLPAN